MAMSATGAQIGSVRSSGPYVSRSKKGLLSHIWGWSSSHQTIRRELNIYIIYKDCYYGMDDTHTHTYIYIFVARATIHA